MKLFLLLRFRNGQTRQWRQRQWVVVLNGGVVRLLGILKIFIQFTRRFILSSVGCHCCCRAQRTRLVSIPRNRPKNLRRILVVFLLFVRLTLIKIVRQLRGRQFRTKTVNIPVIVPRNQNVLQKVWVVRRQKLRFKSGSGFTFKLLLVWVRRRKRCRRFKLQGLIRRRPIVTHFLRRRGIRKIRLVPERLTVLNRLQTLPFSALKLELANPRQSRFSQSTKRYGQLGVDGLRSDRGVAPAFAVLVKLSRRLNVVLPSGVLLSRNRRRISLRFIVFVRAIAVRMTTRC